MSGRQLFQAHPGILLVLDDKGPRTLPAAHCLLIKAWDESFTQQLSLHQLHMFQPAVLTDLAFVLFVAV